MTLIVSILILILSMNATAFDIIDFMLQSEESQEAYITELTEVYLGMTVDEFEFMARVVEAESDRSNSIDGRVMISATILNRVSSDYFPNNVTDVLCQSGQFTTVSGGTCSIKATILSRISIVIARYKLNNGDIPDNVLFFNCIGYNNGEPYGLIDGNYFMTYD